MKSNLRLIRRVLGTALVLGGLAFGTSALFASPTIAACPDDGWAFLGACASQPECQNKCEAVHGLDVFGVCSPSGCCRCLF